MPFLISDICIWPVRKDKALEAGNHKSIFRTKSLHHKSLNKSQKDRSNKMPREGPMNTELLETAKEYVEQENAVQKMTALKVYVVLSSSLLDHHWFDIEPTL